MIRVKLRLCTQCTLWAKALSKQIEIATFTLKGQSHEINWTLVDMSWRSKPEKCLGVVLKLLHFCTFFLINEINNWRLFPIGWRIFKCVAKPCLRFLDQYKSLATGTPHCVKIYSSRMEKPNRHGLSACVWHEPPGIFCFLYLIRGASEKFKNQPGPRNMHHI